MTGDWWDTHLARGKLEEVGLIDTPDPQSYLDNEQTNKTFLALEDDVTLEAGDKYIWALIMLPSISTLPKAQLSAASAILRETLLGDSMIIPS